MWDDAQEKENARRQLIAVVLILAFSLFFLQYFAPPAFRPDQPPASVPERPPVEDGLAPGEVVEELAPRDVAAPTGEWPGLPPLPEQPDPAADEIVVEDEHTRLVFTRIGARLKRAYVLLGAEGEHTVQLVPEPPAPDTPDLRIVYPMGLRFSDEALGEELNARRWEYARSPDGQGVVFTLNLAGNAIVEKTFAFTDRPHVLRSEVSYTNLEGAARLLGLDDVPAFTVYWGPNIASGDMEKGVRQSLVWRADDATQAERMTNVLKNGLDPARFIPNLEWVGVKSAYFIVAFRPQFDEARGWVRGVDDQFRFGLAAPRVRLAPDQTVTVPFEVYLGPNQIDRLDAAWPTLVQALRFFERFDVMDWFSKLLLRILNWFYNNLVANYGVAIILLTVLVRVIMYPLTLKSMRSMKGMQMLAPEIEEIKKKYGEEPQELNKKIMELYRERGINPLGGCLPILLQMPIFIALYRMLWNAFELRGAHFMLWITDLSEPDRLMELPFFEGVPFLGIFASLNLLPILMGASMLLHQKVAPQSGPSQNPQQRAIMMFMPLFFSVIVYNMASGLNLYILTSTVLGMVQQVLTRPGDVSKKKEQRPPAHRKQHWYNAAQQRKRQLRKQSKGK